jgi:SPP1 gp7 family putative phage head morphogenesis protein
MTRAANDILQASVSENVSLIKSIPSEYFTRIDSIVTEGVRIGRDMHLISKGLQEQLGVTKRRAALIAADQTRKASAAILNARYREVGIEKAEWLHSSGGRVPRKSHVEMDGKEYDITKGMWDKDEKAFVFPGQLISCRCVSRAIIDGLE